MATTSPTFFCLWRDEGIRSNLLSHLDTKGMCALRLTTFECRQLATPILFARTRMSFTPSALTRPSRLEALARIGPYIQHFIFSMPHTNSTFLPPLLNPKTGREVNFLYTPHTSTASVIQRRKYGNSELGDILTQQYPPIFHAATNVPAFITSISRMPNLAHLTISCPGQDPAERYRRDAVDYALISLRIAIERAPVFRLEKLSLHQMHPAGLVYLRHVAGYGCTPSAGQRWRQVRKLNITMNSWEFNGPQPGLDHLKILDNYIRGFSGNLEKVSFGWNGSKGPCPLTIFTDPLFLLPPNHSKLFGEVTSLMSPLPAAPPQPTIHFPKLRYMQVRNAAMTSDQVADFVYAHRDTVREFDFENVGLTDGGSWEDALSPLTEASNQTEKWVSQQSGSKSGHPGSGYLSDFDIDHTERFEEPEVVDTTTTIPYEISQEVSRSSVLVTKQKKVRRRRRRKHHRSKPEVIEVSAPILASTSVMHILQPTVFHPTVSGVRRNIEQETAQRELADDPEKRASALKKAKEAVLKQLSRELCRGNERKDHLGGFLKSSFAGRNGSGVMGHQRNSALVPLIFSRY
ncbi:hypothetical protein BJ878DRAFT_102857 [Calycina marina]|uniref:Uncharacterized protein n=1 Tax=Calycina marina TaxID=1763456 RepID=A0A9P7Z224_9HELO|nr:hypothetical protein BJ878DRAFT_102857 [Calycina marina]